MSSSEVEKCDIALLNLLCAQDLRGSEQLDVTHYLNRLDGIARHVESETKRHYYKFRDNPDEFERSEGYFRMLLMAVTLQEDLRIRYNPDRITPVGVFEPNHLFFADARDVFIHGLISDDWRMGTCSSLPVLYVAIGRRLGYPLKLVPTQSHLFVRWEDSRERFNVDATGRGMNMHDDNHYRQWPLPISPEVEQEFGYLKSMTPRDEITAFLGLRGHCLLAMGNLQEALATHEAALRFSPDSRFQQVILAMVRQQVQPGPQSFRRPELLGISSQSSTFTRTPSQIVPGMQNPIPPDPNPLHKIRNQ